MNQIHILNGDAITSHFEASKIPGQIMVCREILAEGKTTIEVGSPGFIQHRQEFFILFFDEADALYQKQFLSELSKLNDLEQYDEITLSTYLFNVRDDTFKGCWSTGHSRASNHLTWRFFYRHVFKLIDLFGEWSRASIHD